MSDDGTTITTAVDERALAALPYSDLGNRDRFLTRVGENFADGDDGPKAWDGKRWSPQPPALPDFVVAAQGVVEAMTREQQAMADDGVDAAILAAHKTHARKSASVGAVKAMIEAARPHLRVPRDVWNAQSHLFNVQNGTLSISMAGVALDAHRRSDRITHVAGVAYDAAATAPLWRATMERWFPAEDERAFMQRCLGACLADSSGDHRFLVWQGPGANGKTLTMKVMRAVLGSYALTMDAASLLVAQRSGSDASPDLARLGGRQRLVVAEEPERGRSLAEGMIKGLTGGGATLARALYGEIEEIEPTFKPFLVCNELPIVKGGDEGIWRRLLRVVWRVTIAEGEQDDKLKDKLVAEGPGILNWLIDGCAAWMEAGLRPPQRVLDDTLEWRDISDHLGRFLAECCDRQADKRVEANELYDSYVAWSNREGMTPMKKGGLGKALTQSKQIPTQKSSGKVFRLGLELRSDAPRGGDEGFARDQRDDSGYGGFDRDDPRDS